MSRKQIPLAQHHNDEAFMGNWSIVNDECTAINQWDSASGEEIELIGVRCKKSSLISKIGLQIATFCRFAKRLWIDPYPLGGRVPTIFLKLDSTDLKGDIAGHSIITVEVVDEKGRIARANLTLFNSDVNGWRARLTCQRRNDDPHVERKMTFVDWNK